MPEKNKKFYLTTSIPYTNASPHIGFALEIIQADVLARYHQGLGEDVFFLTGTDEHGQKTLKAAQAVGKEPLDFADEMSGKFRDLAVALNVNNNDFIRTTDKDRHLPAVYKLWQKYVDNGDIYKKKYKGLYCSGCEAFKTQKELEGNKCQIHQKEVEEVEEENYFFKLSKYLPEIKKAIEQDRVLIIPEFRKTEVLNMISQGLEDVSFSRAKEKYWGWPVPGDDSQVFYVWQDALPNYISGIGYAGDEDKFSKYWPADVHCIGKDIAKFHAIYWLGMLLSAGLDLPKSIFIHGFITSKGQKMSKSLGNVVNPFDLIEKYGVDAVRHYLLREIPPFDDGDFTYEKFEERYSADLSSGLGNLLARVLAVAGKIEVDGDKIDKDFEIEIIKTRNSCRDLLDKFSFNDALKTIWDLIGFCDRYIEKEKPWQTKNPQAIYNLLVCLAHIADLLKPFLPNTSANIFKQLGVVSADKKFLIFDIKRGNSLFPKIISKE